MMSFKRWITTQSSKVCEAQLKTVLDLPGPTSFPFLGTTWIYSFIGPYSHDKLHKAYADNYQKYGNIMKEEFRWKKPLVSIYDGGDIEKVLSQQGKYPSRPVNEAVRHYRRSCPQRYNSVGLVNSWGEEWYTLRYKLTPILMNPANIVQYLPEQDKVCQDLVNKLKESCNNTGNYTELQKLLFLSALESIGILCLDTRLGCLSSSPPLSAQTLIDSVHEMWRCYQKLYFGLPVWKYFPSPIYKAFARTESTIYSICSGYIDSVTKKDITEPGRGISILQSMLSHKDLDPRDVKMTMIDFIAAGIDNTANTVVFALYMLAKNHRCQEKLFNEISSIITPDEPLTKSHLEQMSYLKAVIKETFRICPTIPNIVRILPEDIKLQGYNIAANIPISCHTMVAGLLESNFRAASSFIPERWLEMSAEERRKVSFLVLPFGHGSRACVGRRFAEQEMYVTVVRIIQNFIVEYDGEMEIMHKFLVVPKGKLQFCLTERK